MFVSKKELSMVSLSILMLLLNIFLGSVFAGVLTPLPNYDGNAVLILDSEGEFGPVEHSSWTANKDKTHIRKDDYNPVKKGDFIKWDFGNSADFLPKSQDGFYDIWLSWSTNGYHWTELALYAGEEEADTLIWSGRITCNFPHYVNWYRIYQGRKLKGNEKVFKLEVVNHPSYSKVLIFDGLLIAATEGDDDSESPNGVIPNGSQFPDGINRSTEEFCLGIYWPWERLPWVAENAGMDKWAFTARTFNSLRDDFNIDTVWVLNIGLDDLEEVTKLAGDIGVNILGQLSPFVDARQWGRMTTEEISNRACISIKQIKDLPGLAAYVLIDEPLKREFPIMGLMQKELMRYDPYHPSLIVTMPRDTEAMIRKTQFPISVNDLYPFFGPGSPNGPNTVKGSQKYYYTVTHQVARLATEYNKRAWIMPQAFSEVWGPWYYDQDMNVVIEPGAYYHWRMPTEAEMKWQIWQGLAAGMKGIVFYVAFPERNNRVPGKPFSGNTGQPSWPKVKEVTHTGAGTGLFYNDGSPTPQLVSVGEEFGKIKNHKKLLGRLRLLEYPIVFADNPFNAKSFEDPINGQKYAVIVNNDTENAVTASIYVVSNEKIKDIISDREIASTVHQGGLQRLQLTLEPGEGTILNLGLAHNATCILQDNFEFAQPIDGKTENLQIMYEPYEFSNIKKYGLKVTEGNAGGKLSYNAKNIFVRKEAASKPMYRDSELLLILNTNKELPADRIELVKEDGSRASAVLIQKQEVFGEHFLVYQLPDPEFIDNIDLNFTAEDILWEIWFVVNKK